MMKNGYQGLKPTIQLYPNFVKRNKTNSINETIVSLLSSPWASYPMPFWGHLREDLFDSHGINWRSLLLDLHGPQDLAAASPHAHFSSRWLDGRSATVCILKDKLGIL